MIDNFTSLSMDELSQIITKVNNEITRRQREKLKEAWRKVFYAIKEYNDTIGPIAIDSGGYIDVEYLSLDSFGFLPTVEKN